MGLAVPVDPLFSAMTVCGHCLMGDMVTDGDVEGVCGSGARFRFKPLSDDARPFVLAVAAASTC